MKTTVNTIGGLWYNTIWHWCFFSSFRSKRKTREHRLHNVAAIVHLGDQTHTEVSLDQHLLDTQWLMPCLQVMPVKNNGLVCISPHTHLWPNPISSLLFSTVRISDFIWLLPSQERFELTLYHQILPVNKIPSITKEYTIITFTDALLPSI